jgi:hypothetical protein
MVGRGISSLIIGVLNFLAEHSFAWAQARAPSIATGRIPAKTFPKDAYEFLRVSAI